MSSIDEIYEKKEPLTNPRISKRMKTMLVRIVNILLKNRLIELTLGNKPDVMKIE